MAKSPRSTPTKKGAPAGNAPPETPAEAASPPDEAAVPLADERTHYEGSLAALAALNPSAETPLKGNLQLAALAALRVAAFCRDPAVRAEFAKLAQVKLFDLATLDALEGAARAAIYAHHRHRLTSGSQSTAKVSPALDLASGEVRDRMFSCAQHNLSDDPEMLKLINIIRPGTGYVDRANDLMGLADIYRARPAVVRLDGKMFRETDEADARKHAADLFEAFGLGPQAGGTDWYDQQHRTWVNLASLYAPIARWGKALFAERADVDALFPDLRGASRAAWGSVSRTASDDEKKPADPPATPTG
jgi:hypothetical protein